MAKVGDAIYGDVALAVAAAGSTGTVTLDRDADVARTDVTINGLTLNFNGKTLSVDGKTLTIKGGTFNGFSGCLVVKNGAKIEITGGTFDFDPSAYVAQGYEVDAESTSGKYIVKQGHVHNWSFKAEGDKLTATCTGEGSCPVDEKVATLTVNFDGKTYDKQALADSTLTENTHCSLSFAEVTESTIAGPEYSGDNTSAGTHTATWTITDKDGNPHKISKTVTIEPLDITGGTVALSATSFAYDGTEKSVSVTGVTAQNGLAVDDYKAEGLSATWYGDYTVTVTGQGNFTGSTTASWKINNVTTSNGGGIGATATAGGISSTDGQNFTMAAADSGNLVYDPDAQKWYATIRLKFECYIDDCESVWESTGSAQYTSPYAAKFTVDGSTYKADSAWTADNHTIKFAHSIVTVSAPTGKYRYRSSQSYNSVYYVDYIDYRVEFSLAEAEESASNGKPLTYTINAGAIVDSSISTPHESATLRAVEFKDYTITIPVNDANFKLYSGNAGSERRRVYPAHTHNWTFTSDNANGTMTATCDADGCDHDEAAISLNGTTARAYNGEALTLTLSDTTAFTTHTGATVGEIVYTAADGSSLTDGLPAHAGTYTASVTVTDADSVTHTFSKPITISKVSIADATVVLGLGYEPWYTHAEQNQSVTSVTASGLAATYSQTGTFQATACGSYDITLEGTGSFTGTKTVTWKIKEADGSLASVGAEHCSTEGNTITLDVSQSTSLTYAYGYWYILAHFKWSNFDAANVRVTMNDVTYTGAQIASDEETKWGDAWAEQDSEDASTTLVWLPFNVENITNATDGKLSYTINVGSIGTVAFKDYVFEVPISDSLVLYDDEKNQCWPEHTHNWPELAVTADGNVASSTCEGTGKACTIGTVKITLTADNMVYSGSAYAASYAKSADFDTFFKSTAIGAITYWQGETQLGSAPKYTGNYTAKLAVGDLTLAKDFAITKPAGGYTDGWEVGNTETSVRYDTWAEAVAAAHDGDTIYSRKDMDQKSFVWTTDKNVTLDLGGKNLYYENDVITITQAGSGTLTVVNGTMQQPKGTDWFETSRDIYIAGGGKIVFGEGFKFENRATVSGNYLTVNISACSVIISNGCYQCGFATSDGGTLLLEGGKYWENDAKPAVGQYDAADHVCIEIEGDYKYEIVEHLHTFAYAADGAVITGVCDGNYKESCTWYLYPQTATLTADDAVETAEPYAGASVAYSKLWVGGTPEIAYYAGTNVTDDAKLDGAPTLFGTYTAAIMVGGATASKTFTISLDTSDATKVEEIVNPFDADAPAVDVPASFIAAQVETAGKTTEEIMAELTEPRTEGNGLTLVESYVLGLDPQGETSIPTVLPVQTSTVGELTLKAGGIDVKTDAGATVKYTLETASKADFSDSETSKEAQTSDTFTGIPLPESGVKYYRIKIDLVK